MNKKQLALYLKNEGTVCPFCRGEVLHARQATEWEYGYTRFVTCMLCKKDWVETYTLSGVL
jgi:hypothetical protein